MSKLFHPLGGRTANLTWCGYIISKQPNFAQIEAVVQLISAPNKSCTSSLPGGAIAQVLGEWIVFNRPLES
ncbi:hypothetical protein [Pleurocapsa sp. FMAR1]|uniref:hypothetical protein n=1 Tax=Pleurocapsa sp. FMAR1 TaxID=3040204 RepID=UPI0029C79394|nr:hypothetical protein [Pleurocapsa sp. FMAR1]